MKKIYAFVLACLYASLTSFSLAEETNVTSKYLKNPSFENKFTGWTQTNLQTQTNTSFTLKAVAFILGSILKKRNPPNFQRVPFF